MLEGSLFCYVRLPAKLDSRRAERTHWNPFKGNIYKPGSSLSIFAPKAKELIFGLNKMVRFSRLITPTGGNPEKLTLAS